MVPTMSKTSSVASEAVPNWRSSNAQFVAPAPGDTRFFQSALNNLPVAAAVCDATTKLIAVNRAWSMDPALAQLLGVPVGLGDRLVTDAEAAACPELSTALQAIFAGGDEQQRLSFAQQGGIHGQLRMAPQALGGETGALLTWIDADRGDDDALAKVRADALELKARYENLFNTMPVMLSAVDGKGRIVNVNEHWLNKLGYLRDEVIGRPGRDFLTERSASTMQRGTSGKAFAEDHTRDIAMQLLRSDGSLLDVLATASTERKADGTVAGVQLRMIDITDRNRAEAALRKSEARFQRAVRGTSDGLWDWDLESGLVWYAPRFKELLGFAPEEFADDFERFREALHPDDRGGTLAAISQQLDGQQPLDLECRLRSKTGTYKWFRLRGLAYQGDDGSPRRMAGSIQDITVQKHADQALRDNRNFYELILDSVPDHIAYVDVKLRIKFMNRSCAELFNVTNKRALGARLDELLGEVRYARLAKAVAAVLGQEPVRVDIDWPVGLWNVAIV